MNVLTTDPSRAVSNVQATSAYFHHDWEDSEALAMKIVSEVAELAGRDVADVERIYDHVDPDCLEMIFSRVNDTERNSGMVWFSLDEYSVTVYGSGLVIIEESS